MNIFILLLIFIYGSRCAKILGVFPAPGYSQFILAEKLMVELATRGHEVTVISPYRPKTPVKNYRTISIETLLELFADENMFEYGTNNIFADIISIHNFGCMIAEHALLNENVQRFLQNKNESYDLVIVEQFFIESMMGFALHFEAPLVLVSSIGHSEWNSEIIGNPRMASITPVSFTAYTNHMDFFQRIRNLAATIFDYFYRHLVSYRKHSELVEKYFPRSINFADINASLILLNSHFTTSDDHALVNGMIEIGGFFIDPKPKELSKEVQKYLDDAKDGAIYFSLGTNLQMKHLEKHKLQAIIKVFATINVTVLWKFETDFHNKPDNIYVSKWFKQSDILAHPNVKLFITHGGLLSTTEAVYHGVPMVGIPIFGDQRMNMARAQRNGIAKRISLHDLDEESLFQAVNETLYDPKCAISAGAFIFFNLEFYFRYSKNARGMSKLMRDKPVEPLELAMFWIEYVLRHNGTHFRSPARDLSWYQLWMFDIVVFVFLNIIVFYNLLKFLVTMLIRKQVKNKVE